MRQLLKISFLCFIVGILLAFSNSSIGIPDPIVTAKIIDYTKLSDTNYRVKITIIVTNNSGDTIQYKYSKYSAYIINNKNIEAPMSYSQDTVDIGLVTLPPNQSDVRDRYFFSRKKLESEKIKVGLNFSAAQGAIIHNRSLGDLNFDKTITWSKRKIIWSNEMTIQ